jgi:hypothetical protein
VLEHAAGAGDADGDEDQAFEEFARSSPMSSLSITTSLLDGPHCTAAASANAIFGDGTLAEPCVG